MREVLATIDVPNTLVGVWKKGINTRDHASNESKYLTFREAFWMGTVGLQDWTLYQQS